MKCDDVRTLLSEYVDDVLDEKARKLVDEHLLACHACQEELASLRALVKGIGSLKSVEPPRDFLKQLHERMGRRSRISEIMAWLFYPLRVKIPLQFAGAALVGILAFFIVTTQQRTYKLSTEPSPQTSQEEQVASRAIVDTDENAQKPGVPTPKEMKAGAAEREKKEGADKLILRKSAPQMAEGAKDFKVEERQPEADRVAMAQKEIKPELGKGDGAPSALETKPVEVALILKADLERRALAPSPPSPAKPGPEKEGRRVLAAKQAASDMAEQKDRAAESPASRVEEMITSCGGKILFAEPAKEIGQPRVIAAQIPAKDLPLLLERLKALGSIQVPTEVPSGGKGELIDLRIRVVTPS